MNNSFFIGECSLLTIHLFIPWIPSDGHHVCSGCSLIMKILAIMICWTLCYACEKWSTLSFCLCCIICAHPCSPPSTFQISCPGSMHPSEYSDSSQFPQWSAVEGPPLHSWDSRQHGLFSPQAKGLLPQASPVWSIPGYIKWYSTYICKYTRWFSTMTCECQLWTHQVENSELKYVHQNMLKESD